jgi:hypothetical protein
MLLASRLMPSIISFPVGSLSTPNVTDNNNGKAPVAVTSINATLAKNFPSMRPSTFTLSISLGPTAPLEVDPATMACPVGIFRMDTSPLLVYAIWAGLTWKTIGRSIVPTFSVKWRYMVRACRMTSERVSSCFLANLSTSWMILSGRRRLMISKEAHCTTIVLLEGFMFCLADAKIRGWLRRN